MSMSIARQKMIDAVQNVEFVNACFGEGTFLGSQLSRGILANRCNEIDMNNERRLISVLSAAMSVLLMKAQPITDLEREKWDEIERLALNFSTSLN
jgi:hypothetical protein